MAPLLISFSGIDGSGKSTQIEKLRDYFNQEGIPVRILTFWDNVAVLSSLRSGFSRKVLQSDGQVGSPQKPANRNDKNTQSWSLIAGRSVLHLLDVFRLRKIVRELRQTEIHSAVIFDRYIYDQLAALPLHRWPARAYARFVLSLSPKPDVSYLLDAVPEEARARKPEYPLEFMRQYRESFVVLSQFTPLSLISAADRDTVHSAILSGVGQFFKDGIRPPADSAVVA